MELNAFWLIVCDPGVMREAEMWVQQLKAFFKTAPTEPKGP